MTKTVFTLIAISPCPSTSTGACVTIQKVIALGSVLARGTRTFVNICKSKISLVHNTVDALQHHASFVAYTCIITLGSVPSTNQY